MPQNARANSLEMDISQVTNRVWPTREIIVSVLNTSVRVFAFKQKTVTLSLFFSENNDALDFIETDSVQLNF